MDRINDLVVTLILEHANLYQIKLLLHKDGKKLKVRDLEEHEFNKEFLLENRRYILLEEGLVNIIDRIKEYERM